MHACVPSKVPNEYKDKQGKELRSVRTNQASNQGSKMVFTVNDVWLTKYLSIVEVRRAHEGRWNPAGVQEEKYLE